MILKPLKEFTGRIVKLILRKNKIVIPNDDIKDYSEKIISDGILLNEIPSPTDMENDRATFIIRRLAEFGIDNIETDEVGNILILFSGNTDSDKYLLIYSDIDNLKYSSSESIVEIKDKRLVGIGIGDNSIGVSSLLVLCEYIKKNNITFNINIAVLFSLRNTPEFNFKGINYFLDKWNDKIFSSVYIFGLFTGRLVLNSLGIFNISFIFLSDNVDVLGKNYINSTVDIAAKLYNEINKVDWSIFNATVNIVRITAGVGFEYFPSEGTMDIEIFSRNIDSLNIVKTKIIEIAIDIGKNKNYYIKNKTISYISPANDNLNEVLNNITKKVHKELGIETKVSEIPDYSSIINKFNIPTISLGITKGKKTMKTEYVEIKNILTGFKQILYFIDELNKINNQDVKNG